MAKMRKTASLGGPLPDSFDARDYVKKPADSANPAGDAAAAAEESTEPLPPPESGESAKERCGKGGESVRPCGDLIRARGLMGALLCRQRRGREAQRAPVGHLVLVGEAAAAVDGGRPRRLGGRVAMAAGRGAVALRAVEAGEGGESSEREGERGRESGKGEGGRGDDREG